MSQYLLVTDLDNTLVGDPETTRSFNSLILSRRDRFCLVYATGRSYLSAIGLKYQMDLLEPDYWVVSVGSEIYYESLPDNNWSTLISRDWDREGIEKIAASFPSLSLQPLLEQNQYKVSYFLDNPADSDDIERLKAAIEKNGIEAQVIFSSDRDVDIIPIDSNKGKAMNYIRSLRDFSLENTIVCGDSGNDISLFQQGSKGVLVANSLPELRRWYEENGTASHYLANSPYAGGIIEALEHFGWLHP